MWRSCECCVHVYTVCCSCAFDGKKPKHMHTPTSSFVHINSHNHNDKEFFIPHFFCTLFRLCISFALVCFRFYVGHPMKTVLFLALDRPAVSVLTYQGSYSGEKRIQHIAFFPIETIHILLLDSHIHSTYTERYILERMNIKLIVRKMEKKIKTCVHIGRLLSFFLKYGHLSIRSDNNLQ